MATVSGGDTLFIAEGSSKLVKVHPSVLFSILDHFIRRPEGQKRVIGTLLGVTSDDGSTIEVGAMGPIHFNGSRAPWPPLRPAHPVAHTHWSPLAAAAAAATSPLPAAPPLAPTH